MGNPRMKDVLVKPFKRTEYSSWFTGSVLPYNCEGPVKNPSIWKEKNLPGLFLGYALYAGGIWKGDVLIADFWGPGNDGRIWNLLEKTQCKRCDIFAKDKGEFVFSNRRWTNQTSWRRSRPENIHLDSASTNSRRKSPWFSGRIRRVSSNTSPIHFRMPVKRLMIFGPCQETSKTAITLNQESNFTRREKNHSLFHWNTLTSPELLIQTWMVCKKRRIDDWNIDGSRDLSDSWTGFTQFTLLEENLQTDKCGPGGDWRENSWHPGQITYGQNSGRKWERLPSWRRGKSGHLKNLNSIMHENYEEFISLTLRTRNSRRPSRMLARNWKHQWCSRYAFQDMQE